VSTSIDGTTWTVSSSLRLLYDGWNMIAEYSASSDTPAVLTLQAAHVWGIDLSGTPQGTGGVGGLLCSTLVNDNSTTNNYYPAYDGNGNISAWLNSTGTLLARMDYSPFGQLVAQYKYTSTASATLSRLSFGFSTKYTDKETGLRYYGDRYFDPVTGMWRSKDPIEEDGGLNLYGFVGNDGVNGIDMIGLLKALDAESQSRLSILDDPHSPGNVTTETVRRYEREFPNFISNERTKTIIEIVGLVKSLPTATPEGRVAKQVSIQRKETRLAGLDESLRAFRANGSEVTIKMNTIDKHDGGEFHAKSFTIDLDRGSIYYRCNDLEIDGSRRDGGVIEASGS